MGSTRTPVIIGVTGASGHLLARLLVDQLLDYGYPVIAVATGAGQRVWREELDVDFSSSLHSWQGRGSVTTYPLGDIGAPIASGGLHTLGMIVVPCSMGTLSGIATGAAGNLIERAADVMLKEKRRLVIVPRETPLSLPDLRNMVLCAEAGAMILPAMPAFYQLPKTIDDLADFLAGKILNALGFEQRLFPVWTGKVGDGQ